MKIIRGPRNKVLWGFLCGLTLAPSAVIADPWEVAVVFLAKTMAAEEQAEIDRNLLELAFSDPNDQYRLSILRELPERRVVYFADPKSSRVQPWDPLFAKSPYKGVPVAGRLESRPHRAIAPSLSEDPALGAFFREAFRSPAARRALVVYAHGEAYAGMDKTALKSWRTSFEKFLPRRAGKRAALDILWLDACFMGNLETLVELRGLADWLVASQESEFTSASPFEALEALATGPSDAGQVAIGLGEAFLNSYSFERGGSQRHVRIRSAATLSVVESKRLEGLLPRVSELRREVASRGLAAFDAALGPRRRPQIGMERPELLDLGNLAEILGSRGWSAARALASQLEVRESKRERIMPRLRVRAPQEQSWLVYGYGDWRSAHEADSLNVARLPSDLRPEKWQPGPRSRSWPSRRVRKRLYLQPFTVGQSIFNYFWLDPEGMRRLGDEERAEQKTDVFVVRSKRADNPVVFTGFTQGVGREAERYTGLTIADPLVGLPTFDYPELEAVKATSWGDWSSP